jgi:hypothetical protein
MLGDLLNVIWFVLGHMLEIWSLFWWKHKPANSSFKFFFILGNEINSICMLACYQPWAIPQAQLFTFSNTWATTPSLNYLLFNDM